VGVELNIWYCGCWTKYLVLWVLN